jgi:predicted DNA-binding protein with PD1-like motif
MYFDLEKKEYQKRPVKEQVEVASLIGEWRKARMARPRCMYTSCSAPVMAARKPDTSAACATLEVIVTESPAHLRKVKDVETGLALIKPAA